MSLPQFTTHSNPGRAGGLSLHLLSLGHAIYDHPKRKRERRSSCADAAEQLGSK